MNRSVSCSKIQTLTSKAALYGSESDAVAANDPRTVSSYC